MLADIGGGLVANYYSDSNFQNLALARTDTAVDFNWGTGSPGAGVPSEGFSVRWTGQVSAPTSGAYKLTTDSAGGIKVIIDGKTVIDDSALHSERKANGTFTFDAGSFYDIEIDYVDKGAAAAHLLWTPAGGSQEVIPQDDLYRLGTGWVSGGWIDTNLGDTRSIGGSLTSTGGSYTLSGAPASGTRAITSPDAGQFAYKTLRGDGEIDLKLDSATAGSKAGIVFRNTLDAGSSFAELSVSSGKASLSYRTDDDGALATSAATTVSGPTYLRLTRDGNSFAGYVSSTGADGSWKLVGAGGAFMDTFAQTGFAVSGASSTTRAVVSNVTVASKPSLGGNLQTIYVTSSERPFVDLLKLESGFQLITGKAAPVDSNGWPTVPDFQVNVAGNGSIAAGKYTIDFNGPAGAVVQPMRAGVTLTRTSYNATTGYQVWSANVPANQAILGFKFRSMGTTWGRNIRVLQPGYSTVNTPIYTTRYLNFLKQLGPASLRFMDWTLTNNVTLSDWSQRATPATANWAMKGVAWEACIELCNQVGADMYLNVPGRATDDYVKQLATLVRTKLRPDLNVYVEYGNEMWATNFANGPWAYQQSLAEVQAAKKAGGQSVLNYDKMPVNTTQTNIYAGGNTTWELRRTARRAKQIGDIFKSVWAAAGQANPLNTRVRVMICAQVANQTSYDIMLKFLNDVYGKPSSYIYAIAGAPYFGIQGYADQFVNGKWTTKTKTATENDILTAMQKSALTYQTQKKFSTFGAHGTKYGVKFAMYEGGEDTFGPFNIAAKKGANLDARMKAIMKGYLSQFFAQGGTDFNYFTLGSASYDSAYGTWSITNDFNNLNVPKAQAFEEVRKGIGLSNASPAAGVFA